MKKMTTRAKAHNTKKANEGHDKQARRKRLQARLRHYTANYKFKPMQYAPAPQEAFVPVAEELSDTDTVKL